MIKGGLKYKDLWTYPKGTMGYGIIGYGERESRFGKEHECVVCICDSLNRPNEMSFDDFQEKKEMYVDVIVSTRVLFGEVIFQLRNGVTEKGWEKNFESYCRGDWKKLKQKDGKKGVLGFDERVEEKLCFVEIFDFSSFLSKNEEECMSYMAYFIKFIDFMRLICQNNHEELKLFMVNEVFFDV